MSAIEPKAGKRIPSRNTNLSHPHAPNPTDALAQRIEATFGVVAPLIRRFAFPANNANTAKLAMALN